MASTHETAMQRFRLADTAEGPQRKREQDDLAFDAGKQWPDGIEKERLGLGPGSSTPMAPRPCLTIDKLDQPLQQLASQQRNQKLGIEVHPIGEGADQDTAEIIQGLYRHIEVDSRAHIGRGWAFERTTKAGSGVYRVVKEYVSHEEDDPYPFDQEIRIKRILNQASYYHDPFAVEPDYSDGDFAFVTEDMPFERYKRQFGKKGDERPDETLSGYDDAALEGVGDQAPGWVGGEEGARTVRVAEYWYIDKQYRTLLLLDDERVVWKDEYKPSIPAKTIRQTRDVELRAVKCCYINGIETIDEQDWDGKYIPLIPVIGKEYYVSGDASPHQFQGLIRKAKDSQRMYNYQVSALVEAIALAPRAPFIAAVGQIQGLREFWDFANVRNFPVLPYNSVDVNGTALPPPQRNVAEPAIQAIAVAIQQAGEDIKATTGSYNSLEVDPKAHSGKAIMALQSQAQEGTSVFLDNLKNVSMLYEAKVVVDLMPHVYDRPGRVARILGADDEPKTVMLNAPYTDGPDGPQKVAPQSVGAGQTAAAAARKPMQPVDGQQQPEVKHYDLTKGSYAVTFSAGKSYQTRLQQGADEMGQAISAVPQVFPVIGDLYFKYRDFPGHLEIAERLKKAGIKAGMIEDPDKADQPPVPPQIQQRLVQLDQMAQMQHQVIGELQGKIDAKQQDIDAKLKIAEMDNATKVRIAELTAKNEQAMAAAEALAARLEQLTGLASDHIQQLHDHAHEVGMAAQAHAHGLQAGDVQHQQDMEAGDQGHQQAMEQTQQAADLAPEPAEGAGA